jgi:hypothetical protein
VARVTHLSLMLKPLVQDNIVKQTLMRCCGNRNVVRREQKTGREGRKLSCTSEVPKVGSRTTPNILLTALRVIGLQEF